VTLNMDAKRGLVDNASLNFILEVFRVRSFMMGVLLSCGGMIAACAVSPPPPPPTGPGAPMAADNGQPKMQAAFGALQRADASLQRASPNKGGHREGAIALVRQAMDAVNAGMRYADEHPTEIGVAQGPAPPEPVDQNVPGAERQPNMAQAVVELREARRQLREARGDKGGYRVQALNLIQQALGQIWEGIRFANGGR
jgi:hypothetical protein